MTGRTLTAGMVAMALLGAACSPERSSAPPPTVPPATTAAMATTTVTAPPTTAPRPSSTVTTTTLVPVAPQPSAAAAAAALVSGWSVGNRPVARSVATAAAVATLFAVPYPPGLAIPRGCTEAFPPIVCTYGPPGGGAATSRVFQLYLDQTSKGWYVRSVVIEG